MQLLLGLKPGKMCKQIVRRWTARFHPKYEHVEPKKYDAPRKGNEDVVPNTTICTPADRRTSSGQGSGEGDNCYRQRQRS